MNEPNDRRIARLLEEHADSVFRFCLRLSSGCHAEAEDLAQETLVAALSALPRFAGRARITTYLYSVAINCWRNRRRKAAPASRDVPLTDADSPTRDATDERLLRLSLLEALARLPDTQREAVLLVKSEGFTYREASAILAIPQGTVQTRVHQGLQSLRLILLEMDRETFDG